MGAWGVGNFENDDCLDFINNILITSDNKLLIKSLNAILDSSEYIEAQECSEALCSAEIIAAYKVNDNNGMPKELVEWMLHKRGFFKKKIKFEEDQFEKALSTVIRIKENSELRELWEESYDYSMWLDTQNKLIKRLS